MSSSEIVTFNMSKISAASRKLDSVHFNSDAVKELGCDFAIYIKASIHEFVSRLSH